MDESVYDLMDVKTVPQLSIDWLSLTYRSEKIKKN